MNCLPVELAHRLANRPTEQRWLVEGLWADEAVGIVGGEPKCCKSFLALDLAVAVASAAPCLRQYPVPQPGRGLLYAAEDALHLVRRRLEGIGRAAGVALADLDVHVITAPTLRLDHAGDRDRLAATVAALRPRLLVLDPFVRLHRIDENVSGEVAPLLAYLRELQRRHQLSVAVVHHARKGAARAGAGQALRGSSEFHAWGDSNLYLRRVGEQLTLTVEHRAAASITGIILVLAGDGDGLALCVTERRTDAPSPLPSAADRVARTLAEATTPLTVAELRRACRIRTSTLCAILSDLVAAGLSVAPRLATSPPGGSVSRPAFPASLYSVRETETRNPSESVNGTPSISVLTLTRAHAASSRAGS